MPLLPLLPKLLINKAFKPLSIGTQYTNSLELYELDSKILGTSSVYTSILCSNTEEVLVLMKVHIDKAYTHNSKAAI